MNVSLYNNTYQYYTEAWVQEDTVFLFMACVDI